MAWERQVKPHLTCVERQRIFDSGLGVRDASVFRVGVFWKRFNESIGAIDGLHESSQKRFFDLGCEIGKEHHGYELDEMTGGEKDERASAKSMTNALA